MEREKAIAELQFKAVRSSGAGGQNVNKVSSKVVLTFDLQNSKALNKEEKLVLEDKIATKLTAEGKLILTCDEDRSQIRNKEIVTRRFLALLDKNLIPKKARKATKVPKSVIKQRLKEKQRLSDIKESRRKPNID